MRQIATLALLAALVPGIAAAQQYPNLPANTVVGRLGIGSGPSQAIPFATLSSRLTGASITLNSGNGQTAPGAMSGGNTYSFGANTDTVRMTGLGLGGAAPATGLQVFNSAVNPVSTGQGAIGASSTNGGGLIGQGSVFDSYLGNDAGSVALGVTTGTQNIVLNGTLTAASLSTVGTVAGSLCATSGGLVLYESAANCFAVTGVSVVSGKTLTVDNTIELAGTDSTKMTFPATSATVAGLGISQTFTGTDTFSGTFNCSGTCQLNGTAFGTFATQNYATPPAIGGTTPNTGAFSTLTATTPVGLSSGGTNGSTAAAARASGGLNVDSYTPKGDTNYTILATDRTVGTSTSFTAPRTWTLPAASSVNPGQELIISDFAGGVTNTNTLTIARAGSDTINGSSSVAITVSTGAYLLKSDGVSKWNAQQLGAQATVGVSSINGQTGNPSVVAGTGVSVNTSGGNITVANTGALSFNTRTGAVVPASGDYTYSGNTLALPTRYWSGCQHSNDVGTPNTKVDIAACVARDSTDAINITTTAKVIDFGTVGANGIDAGSLGVSTKYYTFVIEKADFTTAALGSLSPTAPTLPTGYVYFRRVGMVKTDASSHILPFTHVNDKWYYSTAIRDVNNNAVGTTTIKAALSVPNVQGVTAFVASTGFAAASVTYYIWPGFLPDTAKNGGALNISTTGGGTIDKSVEVDSSAQINIQSGSASTTVVIDLLGWQDDL